MRIRVAAALVALLAVGIVAAPTVAAGGVAAIGKTAHPKPAADGATPFRDGLADLLAHPERVDARVPSLIAGYTAGEVPVLAKLRRQPTTSDLRQLRHLGARVLRTYVTIPVVALSGQPSAITAVAQLAWVRWMVPIEVVQLLSEPEVDQSNPPTGGPIDVGVPALWDEGMTGQGVTIAVLDTGVDMTHPDLDDNDFRAWGDPPNAPVLTNGPKVIQARNFNEGACAVPDSGAFDGHGHGTHVAAIAAGTGEGDPTTSSDDGLHMGMAPDATLAVAKVLTDAGIGVNSDLLAALEWAAMPAGSGSPTCPAVGAQVVNTSLGTDSRPTRLNSGHDTDLVSQMVDTLATKYGTVFVAAVGNSGPYIGSALEAPGGASQALSVGATAKDWDVDHDATAAGDTCSGYQHTQPTCPADAPGTQRTSLAEFSSRGPLEGRLLKPDVVAPGYDIVSAQAAEGAALASNDLNMGTRTDPYYATASGTSMASPATAGVVALLLDGYHDRYGKAPQGPSGVAGFKASAEVLVRAALMNTADSGLYESRWILTTDDGTVSSAAGCPVPDPLAPTVCSFADIITGGLTGSLVLAGTRNGPTDPYVGPLAEGAGKIQPAAAIAALRDGVVIYRAASHASAATLPGDTAYQGAWMITNAVPGKIETDPFILRNAPGAPATVARFRFASGNPSDGSHAIPTGSAPGAWTIQLPKPTAVRAGGSAKVGFSITPPPGTPAGTYSGAVIVEVANGQHLRIPVLATVALHDPDLAAGNAPSPRCEIVSDHDVFAKGDTVWPSAAGVANGAMSDWLVYPVDLAPGLAYARFSVYDAAAGDETYDLYLYASDFSLVSSTHPFAAPGVTDVNANNARGPSTQADPQVLVLDHPTSTRYYIAVSRARVGTVDAINGDFGAFVLTLDEVGP